jgi:urease accessory protein
MQQRISGWLPGAAGLAVLLAATPASAHHLMELFQQARPTLLSGLLSGLGHPMLGPDHLLFLLALGLVGLRQSGRWMVALLSVGLASTGLGLLMPGLPGAELLVALSLVVVGLVLCGRLPRPVLLPAFALHGYVLSASVIAWETTPLAGYLVGLLVSQALLLLITLRVVQAWAQRARPGQIRLLAGLLMGAGAAFAWTSLVP